MEGGEGKFKVDCVVGGGRLDGVGFEDGVLGFDQKHVTGTGWAPLAYELTMDRTLYGC